MTTEPTLMTTEEVSQMLGMSERSLRRMRAFKTGPSYYRFSSKLIRYCRTEVDAWLRAQVISLEALCG